MRKAISSALFLAFAGMSLSAGTIEYSTSEVGTTGGGQAIYRLTYNLSGVHFLLNQELDFRFDPNIYDSLLNPMAPALLFDVLVLQPNNPPGAFGDYSLLALVDNPSTAGLFSVDITLVAGQSLPDSHPYFLNQLSSDGAYMSLVDSGTGVNALPEPGTLSMALAGLICAYIAKSAKRYSR